MLSPSGTFAVSFTPSGVSSNAQARIIAIEKPTRMSAMKTFRTQGGASKVGSTATPT